MLLRNLTSISLTVFIASIILFSLPSNVIIANITGLLFFGLFFVYKLIHKNYLLYFSPILIIYTLFTAYSILSIFWSVETNISLEQIILMLKLLLIIFMISNAARDIHNINFIIYGIFFGLAINYLLYFGIFKVSYDTWLWNRYMGTTGNPNVLSIISIYSIFLSVYLIISNSFSKKYHLYLLNINILLSFFMIVASASKKGMIFGLLLILIYSLYFLKSYKKLFKLLIFIFSFFIFILLFFDLNVILSYIQPAINRLNIFIDVINGEAIDTSSKDRLKFITEGFSLASENPFFGQGIATFRYYFRLYAHNNYIEIFFGLGIVGLFIFYSIYMYILNKATKIKDNYLKKFILSFILILLSMDIALVSYYSKLSIIMIIVIHSIIENNLDNVKEKV